MKSLSRKKWRKMRTSVTMMDSALPLAETTNTNGLYSHRKEATRALYSTESLEKNKMIRDAFGLGSVSRKARDDHGLVPRPEKST